MATDGGRYDVNILRRQRIPIYWKGEPNEVRRCSWFHKATEDGRYKPYEENIATKLEEEYRIAFESSQWNRKVELANGDNVVFHGPDVLVLFPPTPGPDSWGNTPVSIFYPHYSFFYVHYSIFYLHYSFFYLHYSFFYPHY